MNRCRLLVIAGSDSGGGAGIQADIKTATAFGVFTTTAVTALTVQDTTGVHAIHSVPSDFISAEIACVLADIGTDAIKTGMLGDAATIAAVVQSLAAHAPGIPLVIDPVMVAKGGAPLLAADAVDALRRDLLPLASVLTPNLPEAEILLGREIATRAAMREAAHALLALGPRAVLLKGGHFPGDAVPDLLATESGLLEMEAPRITSRHTHGTGCTLATAIACGLACGVDLARAVERARNYVRAAIASAPGLGRGHGPLDHMVWMGGGEPDPAPHSTGS